MNPRPLLRRAARTLEALFESQDDPHRKCVDRRVQKRAICIVRASDREDGADQLSAQIVKVGNSPIGPVEEEKAENHPKECDQETE